MTTDASGSLTAGAADSTDIHRTGSGEPTASASRSASRSSLSAKVPTFWLASPDSAPISSRPTGWAGDVGAGSDGKAGWSTAISMGFADGVFAGDSGNGDWFTEVTSPGGINSGSNAETAGFGAAGGAGDGMSGNATDSPNRSRTIVKSPRDTRISPSRSAAKPAPLKPNSPISKSRSPSPTIPSPSQSPTELPK